MKTIVFLLTLFFCFSCSGDDDVNTDDGGNAGDESGFTFEGQSYITNKGEYLDADGNSYVFFVNSSITEFAGTQFIFSKDFELLENGLYTFMGDRYDPLYNPDSNFWAGSVSLADGLPKEIIGGQITVNKQSDGSYNFTYSVTIAEGNAVGEYEGQMYPR